MPWSARSKNIQDIARPLSDSGSIVLERGTKRNQSWVPTMRKTLARQHSDSLKYPKQAMRHAQNCLKTIERRPRLQKTVTVRKGLILSDSQVLKKCYLPPLIQAGNIQMPLYRLFNC